MTIDASSPPWTARLRRLGSWLVAGLTGPRAGLATVLFLATVLVLHRGLLVVLYGDALRALVADNPERLLAQFLDREALWRLPGRSLLFLQQTPPIPNVVLAALLALFEWPLQVAWALLAIQSLLTLTISGLLARLGDRLIAPGVGLALGLLWVLSPDVVVLEAHSFGQLLHESLATLGVLASVALLTRSARDSGSLGQTLATPAALGALAGLLALTRASYAYVALPLAFLVVLLPRLRRGAAVGDRSRRAGLSRLVAFLLPWALLQGGWALKQWIVHDDLRLAPSTWAGGNAAAGLSAVGHREPLLRWIETSDDAPDWFRRFARATDGMPWAGGWGEDEALLPAELRRRDIVRQQHLRGTDRAENGSRQRVVSDLYLDAWRGYMAAHPAALLHKAHLGYALYWFPIRYHGSQEVGLFSVDWRIERSLRWHRSVALFATGALPEPQQLTEGTWPALERRPARLYTLDWLTTLWWILSFPAIHLGVPLLLAGAVIAVVRRRALTGRQSALVAATTLYAYAAVVHSVVDQGENMRFRISVEPVIWLLTALVLTRLVGAVKRRRGGALDGAPASDRSTLPGSAGRASSR